MQLRIQKQTFQFSMIVFLQGDRSGARSRSSFSSSSSNVSEPNFEDFALTLWAALKEVEAFYEKAGFKIEYYRYFNAERIPIEIEQEMATSTITGALRETLMRSIDNRTTSTGIRNAPIDQHGLALRTLDLLRGEGQKGPQIIITDREITPPLHYRYIIADDIQEGRIISIAPMDPFYWGIENESRLAKIKHRFRTTCLFAVGELLGFRRCEQENCFLFSNIDSVVRLDQMVLFGDEHNIPDLANHGFNPTSDPRSIQPIIPIDLKIFYGI